MKIQSLEGKYEKIPLLWTVRRMKSIEFYVLNIQFSYGNE